MCVRNRVNRVLKNSGTDHVVSIAVMDKWIGPQSLHCWGVMDMAKSCRP